MDIIDIIILSIIITFGIVGFKRGFFKSLVSFLGFLLVIVLAYMFKGYLGDIFLLNLPFFKFENILGGAVSLNIIMYQSIAFFIIVILLGLVYKVLLAVTGIFEKILKITIILGIPSKILGLIFGVLEGYIIVYLLLFFVTQPYVKIDILNNSTFSKNILNKTPVLSNFAEGTLSVIYEVTDTINAKDEKENIDLKLADLILKQKVASPEIMQKLVDMKKIDINGIQEVINKYKSEGNEVND